MYNNKRSSLYEFHIMIIDLLLQFLILLMIVLMGFGILYAMEAKRIELQAEFANKKQELLHELIIKERT